MPPDLLKRELGGVGGVAERSGVRTTAFKSRLCTRFMQKGECSYGPNCHFAHGQDDLQNMDRAGVGPAVRFSDSLTTWHQGSEHRFLNFNGRTCVDFPILCIPLCSMMISARHLDLS